jgi:L,D-transpeptidase YcbB
MELAYGLWQSCTFAHAWWRRSVTLSGFRRVSTRLNPELRALGGNQSGIGVAFQDDVWIALWLLIALQGSDPLFVDRAGRLNADGREALALMAGAATDGLDPGSYDAASLQAAAARLGAASTPKDIAAFDAVLGAAMRRYLRQLHAGRVDPRTVGFRVAPHPPEDVGAMLDDAVTSHRVATLSDDLAPSLPLYRELRAALATYRGLAANPALAPPPLPNRSIHAGDRSVGLPELRALLIALGDLPPGGALDPAMYDDGLVEAVKRFQARHGLDADGVVGGATRAALRVPLSWRVRQIELAMERLRWLPERDGGRLLGVNIPMFRLWAIEGLAPAFTSEVIVGRALNTRTPMMIDSLEQVIFRPYWNVPPSILRGEILPALARDPEYLRKHDMEWVREAGTLRVRQRPGPSNSLGLVKFAFPNGDNVYMHGTPAPALFGRARRDFSHGCIRVADPVGLAAWILSPEGWSRDRIIAAMDDTRSMQVTLARPIRVVLFYLTAMALPGERTVRFADDIYGHDATLHRALEKLCGSRPNRGVAEVTRPENERPGGAVPPLQPPTVGPRRRALRERPPTRGPP